MNQEFAQGIAGYFSIIEDPRIDRKKQYKLIDIIVIAVLGAICGAESWVEIADFGKVREDWLNQILELSNGIPSHDTFGRVFSMISSVEFQRSFMEWISSICKVTKGEIVAIDGKTVRRSYSNEDNKGAIHMVSAWANQNGVVLGQIKTEEKSNEITAIPKLLEVLDIQDCIVTIDAMGCQKDIAKKIIEKKADYVLAVKGNQKNLHQDIKDFLDDLDQGNFIEEQYHYDRYEQIEKDHGRIEMRRYLQSSDIDWLKERHKWVGLHSIGVVESIVEDGEKRRTDRRYYISSLQENAKQFAKAVRNHWGIENSLHWVLDVSFREDECRVRKNNAPENFAILRHIALNLIKMNKPEKISIRRSRKLSGWDNKYLAQILFGGGNKK